jgi:RimJ/RimL family protein N-acetyltransferase
MNHFKMKLISHEQMANFFKENEYSTRLPSRLISFGCYDGEELVGVVGLYKTAWHTTEVRGVCVRKDRRGNGLGKFMIAEIMKVVETPVIAATVISENTPSLRAFSANGFRTVTSFMNPETGHSVLLLIRNHPVLEVTNGIHSA